MCLFQASKRRFQYHVLNLVIFFHKNDSIVKNVRELTLVCAVVIFFYLHPHAEHWAMRFYNLHCHIHV